MATHIHHRPLFEWREAFRERGPSGVATRGVGLALSLYANMQTCEATPRQSCLARDVSCDERTVRRVIKELERGNWLERSRSSNGYKYTLTIPDQPDTGSGSAGQQPDTRSGSDRTQDPVQPDTGSAGSSVHRTQDPVQPDTGSGPTYICREGREVHACMPADARVQVVEAFGFSGRELDPEHEAVSVVLDAVVDGVPWDYVVLLVEDVGERNDRATVETVARFVAADLAKAKWKTDPLWRQRKRELERERRLEAKRAEYEAVAEDVDDRRDVDVLEEAGLDLVEAWRTYVLASPQFHKFKHSQSLVLTPDGEMLDIDRFIANELRDGLRQPPSLEDTS